MKKIAIILCFCIAVLLTGCSRTPPTAEELQSIIQENSEDVQAVLDYMIESPYESIVVMETKTPLEPGSDLHIITASMPGAYYSEKIDIRDEPVFASIRRLVEDEGVLSIYMADGYIDFSMWSHTQEISAGMVYSIDKTTVPDLEYASEIQDLGDGWYYYVEDFWITDP